MIRVFKITPRLDRYRQLINKPLVSIILPARNEEKYIARCLESLLTQDYDNLEIVVINDGSSDRTAEIIQKFASKNSKIVYLDIKSKPTGWAGKSWACYQGYLKSRGEMLIFTDADTMHSRSVISHGIGYVQAENLDAITAFPKLQCNDFWTKITIPMLSIFLHTRFSASRVNNPRLKTGYFFGSFFIISREAYEFVGTHQSVKSELVEDGALGNRVKQFGLDMRLVRGEDFITAVWARDVFTLWHGIRRLVIPMYSQDRKNAVLMTIAVIFLMFIPFAMLICTVLLQYYFYVADINMILVASLLTVLLIFSANVILLSKSIFENRIYALGAPLSATLICICFISSIVDAVRKGRIVWRDRDYVVEEKQNPLS